MSPPLALTAQVLRPEQGLAGTMAEGWGQADVRGALEKAKLNEGTRGWAGCCCLPAQPAQPAQPHAEPACEQGPGGSHREASAEAQGHGHATALPGRNEGTGAIIRHVAAP